MKNLYNLDDWVEDSYLRLGEILLEAGKINLVHISMVLDIQRFQKLPIGEILLNMKVITKQDLQQALLIQDTIQKRITNA